MSFPTLKDDSLTVIEDILVNSVERMMQQQSNWRTAGQHQSSSENPLLSLNNLSSLPYYLPSCYHRHCQGMSLLHLAAALGLTRLDTYSHISMFICQLVFFFIIRFSYR